MFLKVIRVVRCCKCGKPHANGAGLRRLKDKDGRYVGLACRKCAKDSNKRVINF